MRQPPSIPLQESGDKPRGWGEVSFLTVLNAFMNPLRGLALCVVHVVTIMFPLRGNLKIDTKHRRCFSIVTMLLIRCYPILVEDQQIFRGWRGFVINCWYRKPFPTHRPDSLPDGRQVHFVPIKNIGTSFRMTLMEDLASIKIKKPEHFCPA